MVCTLTCYYKTYFMWIMQTFLDVMIEMEKLQKLGEDNLDELYNVLDKCDKRLACRIEEYRAREQGYW